MPEFNEPKRRKKPAPKQQTRPVRSPKPKSPKPNVGANSVRPSKPQKPQKPAEPKTQQRRRQNMAIYYVMFFVVAVAVFAVLSATVLFNLEVIEAEGESIYSHDDIIAVANIKTGVNLLRFDTEESKRIILDHLVYIDSVTIRKNFPNKLTIHVVGAVEMAVVEHNGVFYKISGSGRILDTTSRYTGLTVIYGYEADEPYIGDYIRSTEARKTDLIFLLMNTAREAGLTGIVDINIEDFLDIKMNYMDRIVLHVGPATQLKERFEGAAYVLENEIATNERGTLRLLEPTEVVFSPE